MTTRSVSFVAPRPEGSAPTYSLLSLPASVLALLSSDEATTSLSLESSTLEIRGHSTDAAVLVTPHQTYSLRGVQNSNSLCLCTATKRGEKGWFELDEEEGSDQEGNLRSDREVEEEGPKRKKRKGKGEILIETVLHETLELVPAVAKTERLKELVKGSEYRGEDAEQDRQREGTVNKKLYTFGELGSLLPASDAEIRLALTRHRIVTLDTHLRSIPTSYLLSLLPALLQVLPLPKYLDPTSTSAITVEAEDEELLEAFDAAGDCRTEAARQVLDWFSTPAEKIGWSVLRVKEVVREVGIVLLAQGGVSRSSWKIVPSIGFLTLRSSLFFLQYGGQRLDTFLDKWKGLCHQFESLCTPTLLTNTSIIAPNSIPPSITYLPISHLSADPATRFSELFTLRPKWFADDLIPFIDDLGDKKKRDALVMKFVRKVKGADGKMVWSARNLWTVAA
ncbi:BZ3500_MvSof-1268-A1-R1_Chr2-3g05351 [Microbotryum saponariae]|uniref:BZ3500_MvSof-1268-A1-R1_Chr2-3g05351 protein n=1 Tax=Microbotryum saponariae TaxID=289078 RepID=A0A2X0KXP1_9BASI|nr:BZ3500_MvSof-1268-A1-R1_Chr2-3g05351 [Microbotryum saponariae]SDA01254.1 BZ3501_MvSof-1269-A2-R1_Chr2-2g05024 [Microbotryum saponariae]